MIHTATVPLDTVNPVVLRHRMTEAVVGMYRQSQMREECGRMFLVKQMDMLRHSLDMLLIRTNDPIPISSLEFFYGRNNVRELRDDEVMLLFEAA